MPPARHRRLPSPYLTLIITLDDPLITAEHPDPRQAASRYGVLVGGLHTGPALITHDGRQSGIQLQVTPLGARALLVRQAANWGYLPVGEVIRSDTPGTFALALRRPLGVVAGISPWNGAHVPAWRTVVNPVAFGNTVVLRPSEESSVPTGLLIPEIMAEAGFPAGEVKVVTHAPEK